jgi:hypothetical protein
MTARERTFPPPSWRRSGPGPRARRRTSPPPGRPRWRSPGPRHAKQTGSRSRCRRESRLERLGEKSREADERTSADRFDRPHPEAVLSESRLDPVDERVALCGSAERRRTPLPRGPRSSGRAPADPRDATNAAAADQSSASAHRAYPPTACATPIYGLLTAGRKAQRRSAHAAASFPRDRIAQRPAMSVCLRGSAEPVLGSTRRRGRSAGAITKG